jgi:hypothetical protein
MVYDVPGLYTLSCVGEICDKTDCSNYHGVSLLSTSHKNIFLSRLIPYLDDHQCGLCHNRATTDRYCIHQTLNKKLGVQ